MILGLMEKNVFDQPIKTDMKTYDSIQKIKTKWIIIQLVVYKIITISKKIVVW